MSPELTSRPAARAGIYTRISSDPSGQRAGVERQRRDCEEYCTARGWEVVGLFCDNDVSASSGRPRRAYDQLLAAVEARSVDTIVTWHNDRLHRSPRELETFIDLVERTNARLAVVTGGDYDLTTPDGRLAARIVGAVARKESEDRSRRVRRKHLELAEAGKPAGQLGWGVRTDEERDLVREAAERVLAGHGLMTIAREWNRGGVPGPSPKPWTATTLRRALISARAAGLREHGGDPRGRTLGQLTAAVWAPALDRPTWEQLRAVLLNPERNTNVRAPSKYLLTGLIHCGDCGGRMVARPRTAAPSATSASVCGPGISWGSWPNPSTTSSASGFSVRWTTPRSGPRWPAEATELMRCRWPAPWPTSDRPRAACRASTTTTTCGGSLARPATARSG
jgi:DNA invertase Pin-like site-specific DNA recombinase